MSAYQLQSQQEATGPDALHTLVRTLVLQAKDLPALEKLLEAARGAIAEIDLELVQGRDPRGVVPVFTPGTWEHAGKEFLPGAEGEPKQRSDMPGGNAAVTTAREGSRVEQVAELLDSHGFKDAYNVQIGEPGIDAKLHGRKPYHLFTIQMRGAAFRSWPRRTNGGRGGRERMSAILSALPRTTRCPGRNFGNWMVSTWCSTRRPLSGAAKSWRLSQVITVTKTR